jgi:flagellar hook-associated protein 3 FlgL
MRITFNMMANRALNNMTSTAERLMEAQDRVSSGKRIRKPSDDVNGTGRALSLRSTISEIEQYLRNSDMVKSQLEVTNGAMDSIVTSLERVKEIALLAANSTVPVEARASLTTELGEIMLSLAAAGNMQYGDRYIFGGSITDQAPIVTSGVTMPPYSYAGNDTQMSVQVAPWTNATCNVVGSAVFNMNGAAVPTSPDVFSTIQSLKEEIEAGNSTAVSARIADIDANLKNVITIRSEVGARASRLDNISESLLDSKTSLSTLLSETEDADLTQAVLELRTRENVYQAAVSVAGRILNITLADYIK